MKRIEKTIFISYRRSNVSWALAIYQDLTSHGYDVFFDYQTIASGDFERIILDSIRGRAHFVVILTPSALERCEDERDWLRREIETALETKRNIVPLMLEGFDFSTPAITKHLIGRMAVLKSYNALRITPEFFSEAMARLRDKYLNVPLDTVLHPLSDVTEEMVQQQQAAASGAPSIHLQELNAEEWFERAYRAADDDADEQIRCYTEAIRLNPHLVGAYFNRGRARGLKSDLDGAEHDYTEAIRLKPDYAPAYLARGILREFRRTGANFFDRIRHPDLYKSFFEAALQDYSEAIRFNPDLADAYYRRGLGKKEKGDLAGAVDDYTEAIRCKPDMANAYVARGGERLAAGDLEGAIHDYTEAIRISPELADAYHGRADAFRGKRDDRSALADYWKYVRLAGPGNYDSHVVQIIRELKTKAGDSKISQRDLGEERGPADTKKRLHEGSQSTSMNRTTATSDLKHLDLEGLRRRAIEGDTDAAFLLGERLELKIHGQPTHDELEMLRLAATAGHPGAKSIWRKIRKRKT